MNYLSDIENENNKLALLENLPLPQLLTLCETNKFYNNLCNGFNSERIFETRSRNEFGNDILELKEPNMKWKEFYISVHKLNNRKLDFKNTTASDLRYLVSSLFDNNNITELKLLIHKIIKEQRLDLLYDLRFEYHTIKTNDVNFLQWLSTKINLHEHVLYEAIRKNKLDIVKWLATNIVTPRSKHSELALEEENIEIAEFLSNLDPPVLPNVYEIYLPDIQAKKKVSDWLQSKGLPRID